MSKKQITLSILAVLAIAAIAIGGTLAYLTDSQTMTNTFTVGDLDIAQDEPKYPNPPPTENTPGDSYPKDPTAEAIKGQGYMRMIVEYRELNQDGTPGALITSANRLAKIKSTLFYDPTNAMTFVDTDGKSVPLADHRTEAQLTAYGPGVFNTTNFYANSGVANSGKEIYEYKNLTTILVDGVAKQDIFEPPAKATLFTTVVIPSDWNQPDLVITPSNPDALGRYVIVIQTQAIQASNFANRGEAFAALDAEIAAGTALTTYAVTTISA